MADPPDTHDESSKTLGGLTRAHDDAHTIDAQTARRQERVASLLGVEGRAQIIIAGAWMESLTSQLWKVALDQCSDEERTHVVTKGWLKHQRPRIELARGIGIITKQEWRHLDELCVLRNKAAHELIDNDDDAKKVSEKIDSFVRLPERADEDFRERFQYGLDRLERVALKAGIACSPDQLRIAAIVECIASDLLMANFRLRRMKSNGLMPSADEYESTWKAELESDEDGDEVSDA